MNLHTIVVYKIFLSKVIKLRMVLGEEKNVEVENNFNS